MVEFFGAIDRKNGEAGKQITSEYPAWYHKVNLEKLEEEIASAQRRLERGTVPPEVVPTVKNELRVAKEKYDSIMMSKPSLSDKDIEKLEKTHKGLSDILGEMMPSRTDMMKGFADPHEEYRLENQPIIPTRGFTDLVRKMGIEPVKGMITRKQAMRAHKIISGTLERPTNIERLRKDRVGHSYKIEPSMEEMIGNK